MWLVDNFVDEVVQDTERGVMEGGWKSRTLHFILSRTFYHIQEEDLETDFIVVLRSTRTSKNDHTVEFEDLDNASFSIVYRRMEVMGDKCREGVYHLFFSYSAVLMPTSVSAWRSRVNQNHRLRWFMRKATLRPMPWRPNSEVAYDTVSSNALYDYIEAFESGDIFVDPEHPQEDYPHVDSDQESPCVSYPSSVRHSSLHIRSLY